MIDPGKIFGFLVNSWIGNTDRWMVTAKSWCVAKESWNGMLDRCQICELLFRIDVALSTYMYICMDNGHTYRYMYSANFTLGIVITSEFSLQPKCKGHITKKTF